jgi:predicted nucleic acid-binding protein
VGATVTEAVMDASACAAWFVPDEASPRSRRALQEVTEGRLRLVEPTLWEYELLNLVRVAVLRKRLTEQEAKSALRLFLEVPSRVVSPDAGLRLHALDLACRHALSAYDAVYLALAELQGVPLGTADKALRALRPKLPWITDPSSPLP